jgi:hypothetical protein
MCLKLKDVLSSHFSGFSRTIWSEFFFDEKSPKAPHSSPKKPFLLQVQCFRIGMQGLGRKRGQKKFWVFAISELRFGFERYVQAKSRLFAMMRTHDGTRAYHLCRHIHSAYCPARYGGWRLFGRIALHALS